MNVQQRKYGGKEWIEAHGLDEYDSEARWYYPAIMRTTTIDPLCEKYYSISPYAWCGNNPVNLIDPDGMKWDDPEEAIRLRDRILNEQKSLNKDISNYKAQLAKGGLSDKQIAKLNDKIVDAEGRIASLEDTRFTMLSMAGDNNVYAFQQTSGGEHNVLKGNDGKIYIQTSNDGISIHEIEHVGQSLENGGLRFGGGKLLNSGNTTGKRALNEVTAYQAEYSYTGSFQGSSNVTFKDINIQSVGAIKNGNQLVYPWIDNYFRVTRPQELNKEAINLLLRNKPIIK